MNEKIYGSVDIGGEKAHLKYYLTNGEITTAVPFTLLKLHAGCTCFVDKTAF